MNRYVKEIMNKNEGLPKTFEEYQLMHPVHSKAVPMSHIKKLRDEFDNRNKANTTSSFKPFDFK